MTPVAAVALGLDALGSAVVAIAVARTAAAHLGSLGRAERVAEQQRLLASGLVFSLTLKSGAGILRTATVQTWSQLGLVTAIVAIRFALGRVLKRAAAPQAAAVLRSGSGAT